MNLLRFIKIVINYSPTMFLINVLFLSIGGAVEALSMLSVAPIIDYLTNPDLATVSKITQKFIDYMKMANITPSLAYFMTIFLVLMTVKAFLNIGIKYYGFKIKYQVLGTLLISTFSSFFKSSMNFFNEEKYGTLVNTLNNEATVVGNSISSMTLLASNFIKFFFFIIVPIGISWELSLIALLGFGLVSLPTLFIDKLTYKMGQRNVETANNIQVSLQESLNAVKVILGFANQEDAISQYSDTFEKHKQVTIPYQMIPNTLNLSFEPLLLGILFFVLYVGTSKLNVKLSETLVIIYAFKNIVPLVLSFVTEKNKMSGFLPSYEQLIGLSFKAKSLTKKSGTKIFDSISKGIKLNEVEYSYSGGQPVLKNVSIDIPKGKTIALVGKSGSGKTTIADLILGFYKPDTGKVLLDGIDLELFDLQSYLKQVGFVTQEPVLFNKTIKENLLWARPDASDAKMKEALEKSYAWNFVSNLPNGIDTLVGERGSKLSGGERQRLAFARCLLRDPQILVLDEATSALDTESEFFIQKAIEEVSGSTTILVIAHRLSTIKNADIIYVIGDGMVIEQGNYETLIQANGIFKNLVNHQFT